MPLGGGPTTLNSASSGTRPARPGLLEGACALHPPDSTCWRHVTGTNGRARPATVHTVAAPRSDQGCRLSGARPGSAPSWLMGLALIQGRSAVFQMAW